MSDCHEPKAAIGHAGVQASANKNKKRAQRVCDADDDNDNDTVNDGADSCRALPAATPSGCPTAARTLTLTYSKS